ncbi:IS3 family transposase [Vibrio quintilis]|uniref:IS3 family transposase n=3 Tax=Vibrio quintilis TaxID=1117707 RepID=UPI0021C86B74|nr:IS3 family transposase [Vibrio quintilis]
MTLAQHPLPAFVSQRLACQVLNVNRNTLRRYIRGVQFCGPLPRIHRSRKHARQPRALSDTERETVKSVMLSETYCNQPPVQIYYDLLQQGQYLCSVSTMHRLLREDNLHGERRAQRPAQSHMVPRLVAQHPNQVWTWDITKLPTQKRGEYLSLYVVMDLFSRYIVAWMLSRKENSALASQLMEEAITRYDLESSGLTLHQDRGAPMTAHCYLDLLSELAVTVSHSRPRVSNDNPFSESQFKTLKYQPDYPRRFEDYGHANRWCQDYVTWYNTCHYHSQLGGFTPEHVFTGRYTEEAVTRQAGLDAAYAAHPERFAKGAPKVAMPAKEVSINPVPEDADSEVIEKGVNFPTLSSVTRNAI